MHIGLIGTDITPEFYHANTSIPFEPERDGNGYLWRAGDIFDGSVDIKYTFSGDHYIGMIELSVIRAQGISIYVDGVKVRVSDPSKPVWVNLAGRELIIRLRADILHLGFGGAKIHGFCLGDTEPLILPRPKKLEYSDKRVKIGALAASGADGMYAVDFLSDSLTERYEALPDGDGIALSFEISPDYEDERYTVDITESAATVKASSRLALLWGACRVIDLWDGGALPIVSIDDKPDVPMRGFHMGLPTVDNIDFIKRFIRYVLLPFGYNHVIIEFNGAMRFDRHPEISEKWLESERLFREGKGERVMHADIGAEGTLLEKAQVREIIDVLDGYGIEVIPEVQSLAHIEYITNAYPEFAELGKALKHDPSLDTSNIQHPTIHDHCYCPSDEKCMAVIRDIIDEIVEVVKPRRYVHIGHDEAYHLGLCPDCKKKGAPRVYVDHVRTLHDYLESKGLGTMLWSDMLHTNMYYTDESFDFVKRELPKDLVCLDFTWYFHLETDIEDFLLPEGYKVMMGNLYSSHYPRFARRIAKDGMVGGEVSTWTAVSEKKFGQNGKFFDLPYTAEMLWNAYSYDEGDRASLSALIGQCIIPEIRDLMHSRYDLYLATDIDSAELVGTFEGEIDRVPEELRYLGLTEPRSEITVGGKYDRLIFEHATLNPAPRICWKDLTPVGEYTVSYTDGTKESVGVSVAEGVLYISSVYGKPMPQNYYRHQGYVGTYFADPTYEYRTAEGESILLLGQVWDNPHHDKAIASISYAPVSNDYAVLVSAGVLGIKL